MKRKRIIFAPYTSPCAPRVLKTCWLWKQKNEVVCKDACINPLNHFPAPLSLLWSLRTSATRVQGWNEGFIPLWKVPPAVLIQRRPHHANQKRICLKCFSIAARLMFNPLQPRMCSTSALALIKASAKLPHPAATRTSSRVCVCVCASFSAHTLEKDLIASLLEDPLQPFISLIVFTADSLAWRNKRRLQDFFFFNFQVKKKTMWESDKSEVLVMWNYFHIKPSSASWWMIKACFMCGTLPNAQCGSSWQSLRVIQSWRKLPWTDHFCRCLTLKCDISCGEIFTFFLVRVWRTWQKKKEQTKPIHLQLVLCSPEMLPNMSVIKRRSILLLMELNLF